MGETPFQLSHGLDAMIPVEVGEPSLQNINFVEEENNEMPSEALNLDKETTKEVHMRVKLY